MRILKAQGPERKKLLCHDVVSPSFALFRALCENFVKITVNSKISLWKQRQDDSLDSSCSLQCLVGFGDVECIVFFRCSWKFQISLFHTVSVTTEEESGHTSAQVVNKKKTFTLTACTLSLSS